MEILNKNKFMYRIGENFNIPEEYEYVTVVGEAKIYPSSIKSKKKIILHLGIILIIIKIKFILL